MAQGFPGGSDGKEPVCHAGDLGSISGSGRFPREGNGYPLQYSRLENPIDRRATVHGIANSQTWLSRLTLSLFSSFFPTRLLLYFYLVPKWAWHFNIVTPIVQFSSVQSLSCVRLCNPVDCSLSGSSVHGILQARLLERVAIPFCRGSSHPRDQT